MGVTLVALDLVLAGTLFAAIRQNRALRGELSQAMATLAPAAGTLEPAIIGEAQNGKEEIVQFGQDHRPTVVFSFSQACHDCDADWRSIRDLQPMVPGNLRIVYIDTHEKPDANYLLGNGAAAVPVLVRLTPETALAYQARILPQIELLDSKGRVQWTHAGELAPSDAKALMDVIDLQRPTQEKEKSQ